MRYFITRVGDDTVLYETDDELTKGRIIRRRTKNHKISDYTDERAEDMPETWTPIKSQGYFMATKVEVPDTEVFAALL